MFDGLKDKISKFFEKTSKVELKGKSVDELLDELRLSLIENDVALPVADQICSTFKGELEKVEVPRFGDKKRLVKSIFKETLKKFLIPSEKFDLMNVIDRKRELREPAVLLFMGVNGTGKTTTIAKIAYLLLKSGRTVVLACSDTFRAGAIEQLEEHARRVGVKVIKHRYGADPAAAAFDAINYARSKGINAVLIDTAGRMQTDKNLLEEMKKIVRVAQPDLKILIVDALTANDALEQSRIFNETVGIDGIILTKLDADAKGGAALSVFYVTGKPIIFLGVGQKYEDLVPFDSSFILSRLVD